MYSIWGGAILDFVLNLIVIPEFSASGAAVSTLLAEGMVLLLQCWFLRKVLWDYIRQVQIWKILIALLIASFVMFPVKIWCHLSVFPVGRLCGSLFRRIYSSIVFAKRTVCI